MAKITIADNSTSGANNSVKFADKIIKTFSLENFKRTFGVKEMRVRPDLRSFYCLLSSGEYISGPCSSNFGLNNGDINVSIVCNETAKEAIRPELAGTSIKKEDGSYENNPDTNCFLLLSNAFGFAI